MESMVNPKFWKNKTIFLTGHTGFKGSWLALWLHDMGSDVVGYSLEPPTQPSLFEQASIESIIKTSHIGDICDKKHLTQCLKESEADIVIHMAAQPLVLQSYEDPLESYQTNVIGTANVFEAIRQTPSVKAVVNITTDKCYENKEWLWGYRENEAMGGHDPYSSSKACAELVTSTYQKCFFNDTSPVCLASVRAGNVIGGGDWAQDRLVPDFLKAIEENKELTIRNPNAIRPWQHVLEPLAGYLLLAEKLYGKEGKRYVGGWNFGPYDDDAQPVSWIADALCNAWGETASWRLDNPEIQFPHEAKYLKLDCSKARSLLHWAPKLSLINALNWIVDWHKHYINDKDMLDITRQQIRQFQQR